MLANATTAKTDDLIAQNASSYASSRNLFIGVAAGAIVLALLLGFVLSWSLIGPIQRINARLAAIASGDFSGHVDVSNRDELGALGVNVNRMNDELRRLYRELETTSRHKSEFLANMSHELRTPLNAIIGFSQVLRERMFGEVNEKQEEYLDDILSSGNHLLSLINDVLDLSKVEAGQVELEVASFSLVEALESGVVMVRERATKDGVRVDLAPHPEVDVVDGDERRIRQVIFNLLSNAVKFTPAGGAVDVSAAQVDGEVRVSVTDTGPGLAAEDHERIFEEFQQTEAGVEQREGTGLGLALSKRLVELHGGRIWVDSELGQGEHVRVHAASGVVLAMAGERVLVVEDNEKNMKLFRDVLQATGYRTLEATAGERGGRAGNRARAGSRPHGHPASGHRRRRGATPAAGGRAHRLDTGARADRPGDAWRPRAVPGRGLRRLRLEAGKRRRVRRHRAAALWRAPMSLVGDARLVGRDS